MTPTQLVEKYAAPLARLVNAEPARDLNGLAEQATTAATSAVDGIAQSYRTAAMYLGYHDQQPVRNRPTVLKSADLHFSDALAAA